LVGQQAVVVLALCVQALTKEKSEQQLETGRLLHQVELLTKKLREQEAKLEAER
jgi:hypothetical protein